jgi:hypothetical protein
MGLHKLTAGDGYNYLTRQVAVYDATDRSHTASRLVPVLAAQSTRRAVVNGSRSPTSPAGARPGPPLTSGSRVDHRVDGQEIASVDLKRT